MSAETYEDEGEIEQRSSAPLARTDATGIEIRQQHETAAMAVGAKLQMIVQAKYAIARKFPRDLDNARVKILADCRRPKFAESARFKKPQGKKWNPETRKKEETFIEGASIRFAEAAARAFGNIEPSVTVLYDDHDKRITRCEVTDFEANLTWSKEVTVLKTVERSQLKTTWQGWGDDRKEVTVPPLLTRANSAGQPVYVYQATDDEVTQKSSAQESKVLRTLVIRMLPADIVEEAMALCIRTLETKAAQDPEAERKALIDAFAGLKIMPDALAEYLDKPVAGLTPAEMVELRAIFVSLREGDVKWGDLLASKNAPEEGSKADTPAAKKAAETKAKIAKATEKVRAKTDAAAKKQAEPTPAPEPKKEAEADTEPPSDWKPEGDRNG